MGVHSNLSVKYLFIYLLFYLSQVSYLYLTKKTERYKTQVLKHNMSHTYNSNRT